MVDEKVLVDLLFKMYQENWAQGRHHETQRSTVVSTTIAIAAAVIGLVTFDKHISQSDLPLTLFLVVLGVFSAAFSMKHYERFRRHSTRADRYRSALNELLPATPLEKIKKKADAEHEKHFCKLYKLRLHYWWASLGIVIAALGIVMTLIAIFAPQNAL